MMSLPEPSPTLRLDPTEGPLVFTAEQIRCLEEEAILIPGPHSHKKRKVSAVLSAQRSVSGSSTSSSASVNTERFQPNVVQTFDIPMTEESVEVLESIGFLPETANLIYHRYLNRHDPDQGTDDLISYASGHIATLKLPKYDNLDNKEALRDIGLNPQIQESITDLRFSHVFGTQTLYYWAKDTIETNYAALLSRQRLLQNHANRRMRDRERHKEARTDPTYPLEQNAPHEPVRTATISLTPHDFRFPEAHVATQTDIDPLDDHISLYKGKAYLELQDTGDIINNDGSVNLSALATLPGGDFNWNLNAHYWTPEKETAEEYRLYAARRCPAAETCIVHIQISQSFIDSLRVEDLWFSANWKEYVWISRKQRRPDPKFSQFWEHGRAEIVKGHVCSTISRRIARIAPENVQTNINEDNVMRLPSGKRATQWVFLQDNTIDRLAEEVRGKMHFDIFLATAPS